MLLCASSRHSYTFYLYAMRKSFDFTQLVWNASHARATTTILGKIWLCAIFRKKHSFCSGIQDLFKTKFMIVNTYTVQWRYSKWPATSWIRTFITYLPMYYKNCIRVALTKSKNGFEYQKSNKTFNSS